MDIASLRKKLSEVADAARQSTNRPGDKMTTPILVFFIACYTVPWYWIVTAYGVGTWINCLHRAGHWPGNPCRGECHDVDLQKDSC